jgi:hypothetical protein
VNRGRATILLAVVALAAGASACGESDDAPSPDEYGAELDAACRELEDALSTLPAVQREEDLSIEEVQQRADEASVAYFATVEGLDPPEELEDAHAELLEFGQQVAPDPSDLDAMRDVAARALDIYSRLGADGCAESQRRAVEQLEGAA